MGSKVQRKFGVPAKSISFAYTFKHNSTERARECVKTVLWWRRWIMKIFRKQMVLISV